MGRDPRESSCGRSFSFRRVDKESAVGCMSGLLHFFDFHQLQHPPHKQQQPDHASVSQTHSLQDLEAPRNSLELDFDASLPTLGVLNIEDNVHVQIGIQVQTRLPKSTEKNNSSDDISCLQGSKTPNLVARLMGLDLLPDQVSSPTMHRRTFSSYLRSMQKRDGIFSLDETKRCEMGSRSLPETPRISAARRSDVVNPRLSLQLNKENMDPPEFRYFSRAVSRDAFSTPSPLSSKKMTTREGGAREENRSPRAREIVKQIKESVRRRVGKDITNVGCRSRSCDESTAQKTKRVSRTSGGSKQDKQQSTSSCSPRLKHLENKEPISNSPKGSSFKPSNPCSVPLSSTSTTLESLLLKESEDKRKPKPLPKPATMCRKANCERFTQRSSASSSSPRARKKCKTQISNTRSVQVHPPPSKTTAAQVPTAVTPPLPSALSHVQQHRDGHQTQHKPISPPPPPPHLPLEDRVQRTSALCATAAELPYVAALLDRTITERDSIARWCSPSHPLDPTLFLDLENSSPPPPDGPLHHMSYRRLLFDLVDEILRSILKPHLVKKPWLQKTESLAFEREKLLGEVMLRVRRFPSARCETLQDIDGLVDIEPSEANVHRGVRGYSAVDEEMERVVFETERLLTESLVEEAVLQMVVEVP